MSDLDKKCYLSKCCVCVYEEPCWANNFDWLPDGSFRLACPKELKIRLAEEHRSERQKAIILDILKKYSTGEIVEDGSMENKEKTYEQGLEEAWEIARKIIGDTKHQDEYSSIDLDRIFGTNRRSRDHLINDFPSIHEVKEKIAAYEAEQAKPKLGDVVKCGSLISNATLIGILSNENERTYSVILKGKSGVTYQDLYKDCWTIEKTGKHFDIQSMLDEIG